MSGAIGGDFRLNGGDAGLVGLAGQGFADPNSPAGGFFNKPESWLALAKAFQGMGGGGGQDQAPRLSGGGAAMSRGQAGDIMALAQRLRDLSNRRALLSGSYPGIPVPAVPTAPSGGLLSLVRQGGGGSGLY